MNRVAGGPSKETGFNLSMTDLNSQIGQLKDRIECLGNRLNPVLAPDQPIDPSAKVPTAAMKAPALMEIDSATERICNLRKIIDDFIQRLEI